MDLLIQRMNYFKKKVKKRDFRYPETRKQKVAMFGHGLRLRFNRGQCNDDAFIILSANDSTVSDIECRTVGRPDTWSTRTVGRLGPNKT
jgi:hypothetical protein